MYFLLNDAVLNLNAPELSPAVIGRRFGAVNFEFIKTLGQELFAEHPLAHRSHPERAAKLAALIRWASPEINAALFVAPRAGCRSAEVGIRFASLAVHVMAGLHTRQEDGRLDPVFADRQVWRRLAA